VRAHFTRPVTDEQGDLLPNVQISLFDPATTTLISQVVYSTYTGNNILSNPYVSSTGIIDVYLDQPTRVRVGVVQGNLPMQFYEDVDVLAAGSDSAHTGSGPNSVVIGSGASSLGDSSVALGQAASSTGNNAVGLGSSTNALGDYSTAVGPAATAQNPSGTALGRQAAVTGDAGTAVGHGASVSGTSSTALGDGATADWVHATAIGAGAEADGDNRIVIGTSADQVVIPDGSGIVLFAPGGQQFLVTVNDDGSLNTALV
jgi:hypothetical protein